MSDLFTVLTPRESWSRLEPHLHPIDRAEPVPTAEALDRKPVSGMPGNSVSSMVTFGIFVAPAIHRLSGCSKSPLQFAVKAKLTRNIPSATGREVYVAVKIEEKNGELYADPVFSKLALLLAMIRGDGIAKVPLDKAGMTASESVEISLF